MNKQKIILIVVVLALIGAFFAFDLGRFFSLDYIKGAQAEFAALYADKPAQVIGAYFAIYVAVAALSLPGAAIITLAGGAIFGVVVGTIVVSFASSIGATLAMLVARYVLRDSVKSRFGQRLAEIDKGVEREGAFYLFTLRLVPAFPFFVINLVMGLTAMKARTFYWVSQLGMLAGTIVYVNAGTQLAQLESLKGILSPGLIGSFVLLGLFPLIAKKIVDVVKARKVYAKWADKKPKTFDRNMVVIGAGAAGLVTSYIAAAVKAKVTLVEAHKMGGDCLNYGCVPSKALIKTATLARQMRHSADYGIAKAEFTMNFADVMERIAGVVKAIEPHDSVERYTELGVDVIEGRATIIDPWRVKIVRANGGEQVLTTKSIVIATGAAPFVPPLPGLDEVGYLTSDTLWEIRELPQRLVVLGGGPIGCELAQSFARLGSQVTQIEMVDRIMIREDEDVSAYARKALRGRRRGRADQPQGAALREGRRRQVHRRRDRRAGKAHRLRRAAVRGRPRGPLEGLRARGARHRGQPHGAGQRVPGDQLSRTSWPPATWPGPTSSRTPPRTRPGTRPSTACSAPSRSSRPTIR